MTKTITTQEQRAVGPQSIGFDYQFYYFMYLSLNLKHGQKIGYEVKDDVHIDKEDGSTILLQAKHSTVEKANGSVQNLTTMDLDMWKTLNNWALFINSAESKSDFLGNYSFILVTNKSDNNNEFISSLAQFKEDRNINVIIEKIRSLEKTTTSKTLQGYIKNILKIGKRSLIVFFLKLSIETGVDEIIQKIKNRLFELYRATHIVDTIYDSLYSSLQETKYLEIKAGKKFEITFEDFSTKFARCFKVATGVQKLPTRDFKLFLPQNLEDQIFIKQLIDIGAIKSGSKHVILYTTQMLKFTRHFTFWSDQENFVLLPEADEFKNDSIIRWDNEFQAHYSKIERKIDSGIAVCDLEDEIKDAGCELIYSIRRLDLSIADYLPIGIEFTNGHFYSLSNELEIGWHFDWKNKYKK